MGSRAKNAVKNAAKKAGKKAKKFVSKTMGKVMNTLLKKKKAAAKKPHKKNGLAQKLKKDFKKHVTGKKKQVSAKKAAGVAVARLEGGLDRRMDKKYDVHSIVRKKVTMPVSAKYENGKIKPPGYVASDAVIGAGHKYLLGPSRRRIGAGFGRRRAPVKIPHRVKKAVHKDLKKHLITRVAQKPHRKVTHHVVAKKRIPKKVKRKMMRKVTFKSFVKKSITGIAKFGSYSGVTFYKHKVTHKRWKFGSRKVIKMNFPTVTRAGLKNDDISAISVPPGWCTKVYQHANYRGKSMTLRGGPNGKNIPDLTKYQMTQHP